MLDQRAMYNKFQAFRKQWKKQQRSEETLEIDEQHLQLTLKGTPDNLSLLELHCSFSRNSQLQSLLLNCKWFNKTEFSIDLIPDVQSCFYQCSAEDIGTTIMVQAEPIIQEGSYTGMPLNRTIGPISLNKQLAKTLQQAINQKQLQLKVKVQTEGLWREALLKASEQRLQFTGQFSQTLERKQCWVQTLKKTNNQGFIRNQEFKLKLKYQSNFERDLLFLFMKGQASQAPSDNQPKTVDSNSLNLFLSKENDSLKTQLNLLRKDLLRNSQTLALRESQLADLQDQVKLIRSEMNQQHEQQLQKRNRVQSQLRDDIMRLEKQLQQSKSLNMFYSLQLLKLQEEKERQVQVLSLQSKLAQLSQHLAKASQQHIYFEKLFRRAEDQVQLLSESLKAERAEAQALKSANKSLSQENESLLEQLSIRENNLQLIKNDKFTFYNDTILKLQADNSSLQSDLLHFKTLLQAERTISKSDESLANTLREMLLWDNKQMGMHKLANTLAEQLVLKQEELQQQRKVSKQLMKLIRKDD